MEEQLFEVWKRNQKEEERDPIPHFDKVGGRDSPGMGGGKKKGDGGNGVLVQIGVAGRGKGRSSLDVQKSFIAEGREEKVE